jgi:CDP-diacylglycerol--glycerol-3-phosphate 3-phosphatidyltransferase
MIKILDVDLLPKRLKNGFLSLLSPLVQILTKWNVHPNTFTTIGFIMSCIATYFAVAGAFRSVSAGSFRLAGLFLLLSGFCDSIDGKLARESGKVTKFGALYDSTLDRYSEVIFFFGMAFFFISHEWYKTSIAVAIGLGGSLMVSYVRARAEGLGFQCEVGILQRPERLLLLSFGGLIHLYALIAAIWIVAILSNVTSVQRIVHVWKEDRSIHSSRNQE